MQEGGRGPRQDHASRTVRGQGRLLLLARRQGGHCRPSSLDTCWRSVPEARTTRDGTPRGRVLLIRPAQPSTEQDHTFEGIP